MPLLLKPPMTRTADACRTDASKFVQSGEVGVNIRSPLFVDTDSARAYSSLPQRGLFLPAGALAGLTLNRHTLFGTGPARCAPGT